MMRGDDGTLFEKLPKKSQLLKFIYAVMPVKRSALKKAYIFLFTILNEHVYVLEVT